MRKSTESGEIKLKPARTSFEMPDLCSARLSYILPDFKTADILKSMFEEKCLILMKSFFQVTANAPRDRVIFQRKFGSILFRPPRLVEICVLRSQAHVQYFLHSNVLYNNT